MNRICKKALCVGSCVRSSAGSSVYPFYRCSSWYDTCLLYGYNVPSSFPSIYIFRIIYRRALSFSEREKYKNSGKGRAVVRQVSTLALSPRRIVLGR